MAMRQWPMFSSKEVSCRDETQEDMVAIHQPVLKSTTRVGLVALVYLVDLVHLVSFLQPNKRDKPNKPQFAGPAGPELPFSLAVMYSYRMMRGERP
jgi:hypothetical protein